MFCGTPAAPVKGLAAAHAVLLVDHVQAVDAVDALEVLRQEIGGAPRGHDLELVPLPDQVLEDDA
jgi:hypothetical protein